MFTKMLLLANILGAMLPLTVESSYAALSTVKLNKQELSFLKKEPGFAPSFPENSDDSQTNDAARYLNELLKNDPKTYQHIMDSVIKKDQKLSAATLDPILPGSFVNAVADLYASADIDTSDLMDVSNEDKTAARIAGGQEILQFASILQKEAKNLSIAPQGTLEERVAALEKSLAEAKTKGTLPEKVYIYSDSIADKARYMKAIQPYYADPHSAIVYNVLPPTYNPGYFDFLTSAVVSLATGWIFFDRLPRSYPPFYSPVWRPFYHKVPPKWGVYSGWRGGNIYNITNYVTKHTNFNRVTVHNNIHIKDKSEKFYIRTAKPVYAKPTLKTQERFSHKKPAIHHPSRKNFKFRPHDDWGHPKIYHSKERPQQNLKKTDNRNKEFTPRRDHTKYSHQERQQRHLAKGRH